MPLRTVLSVLFLLSQSGVTTARRPHLHQLPSNDRLSSRIIPHQLFQHRSTTTTAQTFSFSNRYWVNPTYYRQSGPVFYFDSGEQNAHPLVPYFLTEAARPSAVMSLARRFDGVAVPFEHRFYGDLHEGKKHSTAAQGTCMEATSCL